MYSKEKYNANNELLNAVWNHNMIGVTDALHRSADINIKTTDGDASIHLIFKCDRTYWDEEANEAIKIFIKAKANLNSKDEDGKTALHLAVKHSRRLVMESLLQAGAYVDAQDNDGNTPLHQKIEENTYLSSDQFVQLLVDNKANLDIHNNQGKTPLHLAAGNSSSWAAEFLISRGANIEAVDMQGRTPLHLAVIAKKLDIVKCLDEAGARFDVKDKQGKLPHDYCSTVKSDDVRLRRYLVKAKRIQDALKVKQEVTQLTQMQQEVLANNKALGVKVGELITSNKKLLEQQEVMGLELNRQQKEIEELKAKVSNLDTLLTKVMYPGTTAQATAIQAVFRGFIARKDKPLSKLSQARINEVKSKEKETKQRLFEAERYEELAKFKQAVEQQNWHKAMQIARGIPEREITLSNTRKINY